MALGMTHELEVIGLYFWDWLELTEVEREILSSHSTLANLDLLRQIYTDLYGSPGCSGGLLQQLNSI